MSTSSMDAAQMTPQAIEDDIKRMIWTLQQTAENNASSSAAAAASTAHQSLNKAAKRKKPRNKNKKAKDAPSPRVGQQHRNTPPRSGGGLVRDGAKEKPGNAFYHDSPPKSLPIQSCQYSADLVGSGL